MSVTEAEEFFGAGEARTPAAHAILDRLADVGLGYASLGQPLTTRSGGERQRLKLAIHMAEKDDVATFSTSHHGLHLAAVDQLLGLLDGRAIYFTFFAVSTPAEAHALASPDSAKVTG